MNLSGTPVALTPIQLFETFWHASRCTAWSITMAAVAMRESRGIPTAFNPKPPDRSYGLVQINMSDVHVAALINAQILKGKPETGLYDPNVNAAAAWLMTAGRESNLELAWATRHKSGNYKAEYERWLPMIQAAALLSPWAWLSSVPAQVR